MSRLPQRFLKTTMKPDEKNPKIILLDKLVTTLDPNLLAYYLGQILFFLKNSKKDLWFPQISPELDAFLVRMIQDEKNLRDLLHLFNAKTKEIVEDILVTLRENKDVFKLVHCYDSSKTNKNTLVYKKVYTENFVGANLLNRIPAPISPADEPDISIEPDPTAVTPAPTPGVKPQYFKAMLQFTMHNDMDHLEFPEMTIDEAEKLASEVCHPKMDVKEMKPLFEAMRVSKQTYDYRVSYLHLSPDQVRLQVEKVPLNNNKVNGPYDQNDLPENKETSLMRHKQLVESLDWRFTKTALEMILDFITNKEMGIVFNNANEPQSQFLKAACGMAKWEEAYECFDGEGRGLLRQISQALSDAPALELKINVTVVERDANMRTVTIKKQQKISERSKTPKPSTSTSSKPFLETSSKARDNQKPIFKYTSTKTSKPKREPSADKTKNAIDYITDNVRFLTSSMNKDGRNVMSIAKTVVLPHPTEDEKMAKLDSSKSKIIDQEEAKKFTKTVQTAKSLENAKAKSAKIINTIDRETEKPSTGGKTTDKSPTSSKTKDKSPNSGKTINKEKVVKKSTTSLKNEDRSASPLKQHTTRAAIYSKISNATVIENTKALDNTKSIDGIPKITTSDNAKIVDKATTSAKKDSATILDKVAKISVTFNKGSISSKIIEKARSSGETADKGTSSANKIVMFSNSSIEEGASNSGKTIDNNNVKLDTYSTASTTDKKSSLTGQDTIEAAVYTRTLNASVVENAKAIDNAKTIDNTKTKDNVWTTDPTPLDYAKAIDQARNITKKSIDKPEKQEKKPQLTVKPLNIDNIPRCPYTHAGTSTDSTEWEPLEKLKERMVPMVMSNGRPLPARQAKLVEDMSVPVESDKAMRMMRQMGWEGGPLGVRGEGIIEPIIPPLHLATRAGLGHVTLKKDPKTHCFRLDLLKEILSLIRGQHLKKTLLYPMRISKRKRRFLQHVVETLAWRRRLVMSGELAEPVAEIVRELRAKPKMLITSQVHEDFRGITLSKNDVHVSTPPPESLSTQSGPAASSVMSILARCAISSYIAKHTCVAVGKGAGADDVKSAKGLGHRLVMLAKILELLRGANSEMPLTFEYPLTLKQVHFLNEVVAGINLRSRLSYGIYENYVLKQIMMISNEQHLSIEYGATHRSLTFKKRHHQRRINNAKEQVEIAQDNNNNVENDVANKEIESAETNKDIKGNSKETKDIKDTGKDNIECDMVNDKKSDNDVIVVSDDQEKSNCDNNAKEIVEDISDRSLEFNEEEEMLGAASNVVCDIQKDDSNRKRVKSESDNSMKHKKRSVIYMPKYVCIAPDSYPIEEVDFDIVQTFQNRICDKIERSDQKPLIECIGLKNGALIYGCHNKIGIHLIESVASDINLKTSNVTTLYEDRKRFRVSARINSYLDINLKKLFVDLEEYNEGLKTDFWSVSNVKKNKDSIEMVIELDLISFEYISKNGFGLFAGMDKMKFSVIWN